VYPGSSARTTGGHPALNQFRTIIRTYGVGPSIPRASALATITAVSSLDNVNENCIGSLSFCCEETCPFQFNGKLLRVRAREVYCHGVQSVRLKAVLPLFRRMVFAPCLSRWSFPSVPELGLFGSGVWVCTHVVFSKWRLASRKQKARPRYDLGRA
jgi:hypothetical protein